MTRRPVWMAPLAALAVMSCGAGEATGSPPRPVPLGPAATQVVVVAPPGLRAAPNRPVQARLRLSGLRTDLEPGVLYRVQLGGRDGPVLGYINFFNVATGGEASFSFDAGPALTAVGRADSYVVVLTPEGDANPAAHPVVDVVEIVAGS